jgi:hypothetical protein
MEAKQLLKESIEHLSLGEEALRFARANGFETLADLLHYRADELMRLEGFTFRGYKQLIEFLEDNDLLHLLKE